MEQISIIREIEGVGPVYGNRLASAGIKTIDDLHHMNIKLVHKRTEISMRRLRAWQSMAVLQEIQGIDHQNSDVLVRGGITNQQDLIRTEPNRILKMIDNARSPRDKYNIIPDDYKRDITLADVKGWQNEASQIASASIAVQLAISRPYIINRADWGARQATGEYTSHSPDWITIHHTATPQNGASRVRSIQNYHMHNNGWIDIGYHYLIGSQGNIYEGRPVDVVGAHVGGYNTGNVGIAVIGNYQNEDINQRQQRGIEELGAWLCSNYSISPQRIYGHRDFSSTVCPGDYLYDRLPDIRSNIENRLSGAKPEEPKQDGGCFIATAAYGSSLAPDVQFLRDLRDKVLRQTKWGRQFFNDYWRYYYEISPPIAHKMELDDTLRKLLQWSIVTPFVNYLKLVVKRPQWNLGNMEPELKMYLTEMKQDMDEWLSSIEIPDSFENMDNQSIIDEINIVLDFILKENGESYLDNLVKSGWLPLKYDSDGEENLRRALLNSGRSAREVNMILYGKRKKLA